MNEPLVLNRFGRTFSFTATVDDCDAEEFLYEAAIMRRLKHPNVLGAFGVSVYEGAQCVLMPLMINGDLKSYMKRYHAVSIVRWLLPHLKITAFSKMFFGFFKKKIFLEDTSHFFGATDTRVLGFW